MPDVAAIVVAAGRGMRAGGDLPKQFRQIGGETMLRRTLSMFLEHANVGLVQPVIHREDLDLFRAATANMALLAPAFGGATRQASVRAASWISTIAATQRSGAAIPALPVTDTVKSVDAEGHVDKTLDRNALRLVQTPQGFAFAPLLAAHRRAAAEGREDFSDDAALAEWAGMTVSVFAGEPGNIKITTPEDFARSEAMQFAALGDVRTGNGIDVHAFGPGDHVMLGGIRIAHDRALVGHSDADVALHALTDAILGALADGDIGAHS